MKSDLIDLETAGIGDLLKLYSGVLAELRRRGVTRTDDAPTGGYAEWLTWKAFGGELQANSNKSSDLLTPRGKAIQVKSRVVSDPPKRGQRQLSPFRSWDFDYAVVVLFDNEYRVHRAAQLKVAEIRSASKEDGYVNANRVFATDALLKRGRNITAKLRTTAETQDAA
ncbi:MAG TPA: hypothetical protein VIT85_07890 [Solirubrobacterales bacterium]